MAESMNLENWAYKEYPDKSDLYQVVGIRRHFDDPELLLGIKNINTGKTYIIGEEGVEEVGVIEENFISKEDFEL